MQNVLAPSFHVYLFFVLFLFFFFFSVISIPILVQFFVGLLMRNTSKTLTIWEVSLAKLCFHIWKYNIICKIYSDKILIQKQTWLYIWNICILIKCVILQCNLRVIRFIIHVREVLLSMLNVTRVCFGGCFPFICCLFSFNPYSTLWQYIDLNELEYRYKYFHIVLMSIVNTSNLFIC